MIPWRSALALLLAIGTSPGAEAVERLSHRVWLLHGIPAEMTLAALRSGGVDGLVLPVGDLAVSGDSCRLTLAPLPDLKALAGWPVTPLVWVSGSGKDDGDAATFLNELAPVRRLLPGDAPLMLAARTEWPGLVPFAADVAKRVGSAVELTVPAASLARLGVKSLPSAVRLVVVVLGNPSALGFPASTPADDLGALDQAETFGSRYRAAVVVAPVSTPPPGPAGASLAAVVMPAVAEFKPTDRGYTFVLRQGIDWGGTALPQGSTIQVEVVDTARYDRDLGMILRSVRPGLVGWDAAGLPDREPTLGMSLEAFLAHLRGGEPFPNPQLQVDWATPTRLDLALANPTAQASALAGTGNWLEVRFSGASLLDVGLGDFSGAEYGRVEYGSWRRVVARDATAIRLYFIYMSPASRLDGAVLTFLRRPTAVTAHWVLRLGDGREIAGSSESVPLRKP